MEYISISHWGLFEAHDPVVERVREKFKQRSQAGLAKYGVGLDRPDLTREQWMTHLQEELMDAVNYIEAEKYNTENGYATQNTPRL